MADPVNWRFDPFTETYNAISKTNEDHTVPGSSPYWIRLYEVPRSDSPSSITAVILVELDEDLDVSETGVDILAAHYGRVNVNDVLLCDSEQMLVTGKPGSPTLNVTRGYGGTTPATHTDGTLMEILNSLTERTSGSPAAREFRVDYKYNTGLVLFNSAQSGYDIRFDYYGLGTPFHVDIEDFVRTAIVKDAAITLDKLKQTLGSGSYDIGGTSYYTISLDESYMHDMRVAGESTDVQWGAQRALTTNYRVTAGFYNANVAPQYVYWQYYYHANSPELAKAVLRDGKIVGVFCGLESFDSVSGIEETEGGILVQTTEILIPEEVVVKIKNHKDFKDCKVNEALFAEKFTGKEKKLMDFLKSEGL